CRRSRALSFPTRRSSDLDWRQGLTMLQLVKAALSGPQDLFLADGANDQARRVWQTIGGTVPLLYNLHWTRPLRPARYLLSLLERSEEHTSELQPRSELVS